MTRSLIGALVIFGPAPGSAFLLRTAFHQTVGQAIHFQDVDAESQAIEGPAGETFLAERGGSTHRTATASSSGDAGEAVWALGWCGHGVSPAGPQGIAHHVMDRGRGGVLIRRKTCTYSHLPIARRPFWLSRASSNRRSVANSVSSDQPCDGAAWSSAPTFRSNRAR